MRGSKAEKDVLDCVVDCVVSVEEVNIDDADVMPDEVRDGVPSEPPVTTS